MGILTAIGELPNSGERELAGQGLDMNLCLLMFSWRIFLSRVERGIPSLAAAPVGPATFPLLVANASSMIFFS